MLLFRKKLVQEKGDCPEVYFFRTNQDKFGALKTQYIDGLIQKCEDSIYLDCFLIKVDTTNHLDSNSSCITLQCRAYVSFMDEGFFRGNLQAHVSKEKSSILSNTSEVGTLLDDFSELSNIVDSPKESNNLFTLVKYQDNKVKEWNSLKINSDTTIIKLENILRKKCTCKEESKSSVPIR